MAATSEVDLWHNYISEMRRPYTWPDNMLLMCSAWFIGRDIIILSEDGEGYSIRTRYRPKGMTDADQYMIRTRYQLERVVNPGPALFLAYIKNTHYQALVPMRTLLHDVVCGGCGILFKVLRAHLNRSLICRSYYNIRDLDVMAMTVRRCEHRQTQMEKATKLKSRDLDRQTQLEQATKLKSRDLDMMAMTLRRCEQRQTELEKAEKLKYNKNLPNLTVRTKKAELMWQQQEEIREKCLQERRLYNRKNRYKYQALHRIYHEKNREKIRQRHAIYYKRWVQKLERIRKKPCRR